MKLELSDLCKYHNAKIWYKEEVYTLTQITVYESLQSITLCQFNKDLIVCDISDCKLVLKDLQDITDKELYYIIDIFTNVKQSNRLNRYTVEDARLLLETESYIFCDYRVVDKLREWNYNVDNLIERDKAIKPCN